MAHYSRGHTAVSTAVCTSSKLYGRPPCYDTLENELSNDLFSTILNSTTETRSKGGKLLRYLLLFMISDVENVFVDRLFSLILLNGFYSYFRSNANNIGR